MPAQASQARGGRSPARREKSGTGPRGVSTIAAMIVMAVAPAFLKSAKDLKKASVNLHGQGR